MPGFETRAMDRSLNGRNLLGGTRSWGAYLCVVPRRMAGISSYLRREMFVLSILNHKAPFAEATAQQPVGPTLDMSQPNSILLSSQDCEMAAKLQSPELHPMTALEEPFNQEIISGCMETIIAEKWYEHMRNGRSGCAPQLRDIRGVDHEAGEYPFSPTPGYTAIP